MAQQVKLTPATASVESNPPPSAYQGRSRRSDDGARAVKRGIGERQNDACWQWTCHALWASSLQYWLLLPDQHSNKNATNDDS